jgi:DNA-binding CsgD family transcriptional regulator
VTDIPVDTPDPLTPRERQVASLAAAGVASAAIAEQLGVSRRTVDNQLGRVYTKLGISGRSELASVLDGARPA